jgi:hypothetical protein
MTARGRRLMELLIKLSSLWVLTFFHQDIDQELLGNWTEASGVITIWGVYILWTIAIEIFYCGYLFLRAQGQKKYS